MTYTVVFFKLTHSDMARRELYQFGRYYAQPGKKGASMAYQRNTSNKTHDTYLLDTQRQRHVCDPRTSHHSFFCQEMRLCRKWVSDTGFPVRHIP